MALAGNTRAILDFKQLPGYLLPPMVFAGIYWIWQLTYSQYDTPLWQLSLCGLVAIIGLWNSVSRAVWLWWGLGVLTLLWSLSPGQTLAAALWELLYLAAFVAASSLRQQTSAFYWILNFCLLGYGLFSVLSLDFFNTPQFFSGSIHYITGAQALILVPPLFAYLNRSPRWGLMVSIGLVVVLYAAMLSSARAVYLPLLLITILMIGRAWLESRQTLRILAIIAIAVGAVWVLDWAMPGDYLAEALGSKTSVERQASDFQSAGSFGSRLQMWKQTLHIAFKTPQGTGNGDFREVLAAYQQYPTVLFSSPHNYYLETAATGGWLRFIALIWMLGAIWYRGWKTAAWPYVLGSMGLWLTLGFDITGMYPSVMMLAFASLGFVYGQTNALTASQTINPSRKIAGFLGIAVAILLMAWWYWPCQNNCALQQKQGFRPAVLEETKQLLPADKLIFLEQAAQLNPQSIWVYRALLDNTQNPSNRLDLLQRINQKFPLYAPTYYLEQAQLAYQAGQTDLALETLQRGLKVFPPDLNPAGVPLFNDANAIAYKAWIDGANSLLMKIKPTQ